jgi:hypothetical protein
VSGLAQRADTFRALRWGLLAGAIGVRPATSEGDARLRVGNLGVEHWGVWARQDAGSVLGALDDLGVRCLVVDLGSLPTREEQALVAGKVASHPAVMRFGSRVAREGGGDVDAGWARPE